VGEKVAELARLRRRRFISQPSDEAEGNRSVRWVGEKVAELARLRRRRSISQPRVAELARLPWVFQRAAPNPAKGCTPCAQGCAGDSARGPMEQSEEALKDPRDNRLPILKGLNRYGGGIELKTRGFGETRPGVGRRVRPGPMQMLRSVECDSTWNSSACLYWQRSAAMPAAP